MKIKQLLLLAGLLLMYGCKPKDPDPNMLIGSWSLVASKSTSDADWKTIYSNSTIQVTFLWFGIVSSITDMPFQGGWCNKAERYSIKDKQIFFKFGKPNCIPLLTPTIPAAALLIELTPYILVLRWGEGVWKFNRV